MLQGLKTYLVAIIAVVTAVLGLLSEQITFLQAVQAIGLALGLGGVRSIASGGDALNSPFPTDQVGPGILTRKVLAYGGVLITVLTAILAGLSGDQSVIATVSAVLAALGLNFLGLGVQKAVQV